MAMTTASLRSPAARAVRALAWLLPLAGMLAYFVHELRAQPQLAGDHYPVYWGAKAWLESGNAYDLSHVGGGAAAASTTMFSVGNVYPLPATLLLGLPYAWLPPMQAGVAFAVTTLAGIVWLLRRLDLGPAMLWSLPLLEATRLLQTSLVSLFAYLLLWHARTARRPWLVAIACGLLSLKPQEGVAGIAVACWWYRRELWRIALVLAGAWLPSLLLQPGWVPLWLHHLGTRGDVIAYRDPRLLALLAPVGLLVALMSRARDGAAREGFVLAGVTITASLLLPWPMPGWYPGIAWMVGLPRSLVPLAVMFPWSFGLFVPAPLMLTAGVGLAMLSYLREQRRPPDHHSRMRSRAAARSAG